MPRARRKKGIGGYKPDSVLAGCSWPSIRHNQSVSDDHLSLRSTRNISRTGAARAMPCSLFDLAPGRVYHAIPLARGPGGLLLHLFTLILPYYGKTVYFLWHWPYRGISSATSRISPGFPALRSPDFPLHHRKSCSGRPPPIPKFLKARG